MGSKKYNIAMCCDFFYPQLGGVEFHMYHLAQKLINDGHNVIIITHSYGDRMNIRYIANGLKVYYIPLFIVTRETSFPSVFSSLPILRRIFIKENVNIVHSHGTVTTISHEAIIHASIMDIPTVITDHSLFPFNNISHILVNKLLRFSTTLANRLIGVSQTTKENLCVRTGRNPDDCFVIPNAVVSADFQPLAPEKIKLKSDNKINIVIISRLFENKGIALLIDVIPKLCNMTPDLNFIIAGDGPMFIDLQQMIESNSLEERINLIGSVPHEKVRDVMVQGDIYLHCSLIEAFGTVLVEAASTGLVIVTTTVGGILEVLPDDMAVYCHELTSKCIIDGVNKGIQKFRTLKNRQGKADSLPFQWKFHNQIKKLYNWENVAERTVHVYDIVSEEQKKQPLTMLEKIVLYYSKRLDDDDGVFSRLLYALCCTVDLLYLLFLDHIWDPRKHIEPAIKWNRK